MLGQLHSTRCLLVLALTVALTPCIGDAQNEASRFYVRRIEFQGVTRINDNVLRRELLQLEGTYVNTVALEQSRLRLEQLPFIESAQVSLERLDSALNQVDVVFQITEAPSRFYGGGGAYSKSQRASLNGYFINENIFGTGQRFSASLDVGDFRKAAEFSHTNPYVLSDRVSRTIAVSSLRISQLTADTSDFDADQSTARFEYSYRTGESHALGMGIALHDVDLITGSRASDQHVAWVRSNGNSSLRGSLFATDFSVAEFLVRWREDTRNRSIFPDSGREQSATFRSAVPGSDAEYYAIEYELTSYWPLDGRWTASLSTHLGYGAKYSSSTSSLPPYLNWFAGGPSSVRGFREDRLGPQDSLGNPYGGNLFVSGQFEILMPWPDEWRKRTRFGFFYDVGSVFSTESVAFVDDASRNLDYGFKWSRLRQSVGISAQILIPIGVLRLSYGVPLNARDDHPNRFLRDDTDRFQVAVGVDF